VVKKWWISEINSEWKINIKAIKNYRNTSYEAYCKMFLTFVAKKKGVRRTSGNGNKATSRQCI